MYEPLSAQKVYNYLQTELAAYHLDTFGELKLTSFEDEESDDDLPVVSWSYTPISDTGLDVSILYYEFGVTSLHIGPLNFQFDNNDPKMIKQQILKTILVTANGQLKLVVTHDTVSTKTRWQAAEMYLLGFEKHPTIISVVSNHTRSAKHLAAVTLANNEPVDRQIITNTFWLLPVPINGKYPKSRTFDLEKPTSLTRSVYKKIDTSLMIQSFGGEAWEPFWSYFYRTTEFWLVVVVLGIFDFWIIDTFIHDDSAVSLIVKNAIHLVNTILAIALTVLLLSWRQKRLEANNTPRFERIEDGISILGISKVLSIAAIATLLFAPFWTPIGDTTHLDPGTKYIFTTPTLLIGCLLLLAPLVFNKTAPRTTRFLVSSVYALGLALIFITNSYYMNGSDSAPATPVPWLVLGVLVPISIGVWMFYKTFAKPNPRDQKEWN